MTTSNAPVAIALALAAASVPAGATGAVAKAPAIFRLAVIPVDLADERHTFTAEQLAEKFFSVGTWRASPGGKPQLGSIREYWTEVSYGKLTLTGQVFPWVTMSRRAAEYEGREDELVAEAKAKAGYDPARFDAAAIVYAGLQRVTAFPYRVHASPSGRYYVVNEAESADHAAVTDLAAIGADCHELGHLLGLPDLYWAPSSFGPWDLMALNGACPQHPSAWSKEQLGWLEPRIVVEGSYRGRALPPLAASATADKLVSERTVFYVENRQPVGFDACLPAHGIVISRVDPATQVIALEQADAGTANAHAPEGDVFPGTTGQTRFGCATVPSSRDAVSGACAVEIGRIAAPPGGDATYDLELTWRGAGITVDGAGNYPSLFAALEVARPGQAVGVPAGVFDEPIALKPGVALLGAGAGASVLRAGGRAGGWLVTGGDGVVISGFTLQGGGARGGLNGASVGDGAEVSNNAFLDFAGPSGVALALRGARTAARVVNNVFRGNGIAIYRDGPAELRRNAFVGNGQWSYANGPWPYTGGENEVATRGREAGVARAGRGAARARGRERAVRARSRRAPTARAGSSGRSGRA